MRVTAAVWAITMTALLGASAHADDSLLAAQSRIARDAAANGHCDVVTQVAAQVAQTDHTYYTTTFLSDPTLGYCLGVPGAQPPPPKVVPRVTTTTRTLEGTPPLEGSRVAGELALGGTAGFIGGALGLVVGFGLAMGCSSDCGGVYLGGGLAGVTVGASLGVYAVGSQDHQHGSYAATFGGAVVGTLAGVGIATIRADNRGLGLAAIVAAPAITSTLMFNLTRRYDVVPVPTSHGIALAGTF